MIVSRKNERERLEGGENVPSVINGDSTWMAASFTEKTLFPEFIEATRDFLKFTEKFTARERTRENLGNWFAETRQELYSLDLHHRGTIVLRNELEMVPGRFALALELRDVRRQFVKIDFRGSRHGADLQA